MNYLILPTMLVWLLLAISIGCVLTKKSYWQLPLTLTLIAAVTFNVLTPIGATIIISGLAIAYFTARQHTKSLIYIGHGAVILWVIGLIAHLYPGINNLLVLNQVNSGPLSLPFTLYFNIDKPMLIFALLLLVPNIVSNNEYNWHQLSLSRLQKWILGGGLITLPLLAWGLQLVKPEFTIPSWWWIFAINNLIFTCVAEEVLFRGYIQGFLCKKLSPTMAIIIASVLFGLAHLGGGPLFVIIATLAGILYGVSYYWTKKITVAIVVHFAFNLLHLAFFTYPLPL
ncbi:CPBP family intramembrane metalloprotease [Photobacterium phosphoreum]|uniref:CPBP family intramembrane metalloprotease n=2 Tax=Photobacterium phosphoreum TaxID=659 RepID=A0A2T3JHQ9_PHOPO|nr:CPBP family intramembrane metalloprotease [Photobacterium phosphoreum]PSU41266.1 CPBP family intramembrane metalloprotease [Photobacterium phosphoreum]PSU48512.1 CPBP family intramembrane metalloprotease [Photobacterium phosphoreum]